MRSHLFLDKISCTCSVPEEHHIDIDKFFEGQEGQERVVRIGDYSKLMNYQHAGQWHLWNGDAGRVLVHWCPRRNRQGESNKRYLRFEFNPAKLHQGCLRTIFDILEPCFDPDVDFERFVADLRFTRFDLTVDVSAAIEGLVIFHLLHKSQSKVYTQQTSMLTPHGRINGYVIGAPESDRQMTVYDKVLQLKKLTSYGNSGAYCRSKSGAFIPIIPRSRPKTRIELTVKEVDGIHKLLCLSNPFAKYHIKYYMQMANDLPKHMFLFFLEACKGIGAQAALSLIDDQRTRTKYVNVVKEVPSPSWWNPEEIWGELPSAVSKMTTYAIA